MRLYKFLNEQFGLQAIKDRRIKISIINELNDPFEFLGINLSNSVIKNAIESAKEELSKEAGLVCFSKKYSNPVLWSHYADKHKGLCLGFDVNLVDIAKVNYVAKRLRVPNDIKQAATIISNNPDKQESFDDLIFEKFFKKVIRTKFNHWKYEGEYRAFTDLDEKEIIEGNELYFISFSDQLVLKEVIIGIESKLDNSEINELIKNQNNEIKVCKAIPSKSEFKIEII